MIAEVTSFNTSTWCAEYLSTTNKLPTSDTPLHWLTLIEAKDLYNWKSRPLIALHGHALEKIEIATLLDIPCSIEQTLFSTREDYNALAGLISKFPYPKSKLFIRRDHGFFLLAQTFTEALTLVHNLILPALSKL